MEQISNNKEMIVIDVRTPGEFSRGHIEGSINIPLNEIENRVYELQRMDKAILLCCASGVRSTQAYNVLVQHGIKNIHNAGSWAILQHQLNDIKQTI